jgi:RNA polymerase sigma factor (sigma-70 family)
MNNEKGEPVATAYATVPLTETSVSLSRLFREHYRRILLAAYRITGCMADAEDVTQAVFLRLASGDELGAKNPGSYLYRAGINGALDLLRRRKVAALEPLETAAGIASAGMSPDAEISSGELGQWLRQAISELPARAAEMFTLRYLEELGNREIAALMGTSQAVVAVTLHHARSKLKKRLREIERGMR